MMRTVNLSDAPGAESAGKYLLTLSYMEHFTSGIISQCDLSLCRMFITAAVQNGQQTLCLVLLAVFRFPKVFLAFISEVRLNYVSLSCSQMTDRNQKVIEM